MDILRSVICDVCGKEFFPAPQHVYKTHDKIFCSWHCTNAYHKAKAQKKEQRESEKEQKKKEKRARRVRPTEEEIANRLKKARNQRAQPVCQYTQDGKFVAEYFSMTEAERQTGIRTGGISSCVAGIVSTAGGYVWKRKENKK